MATFVACSLGQVSVAYSDQFLIRDRASRSPLGFVKISASNRTFYTDSQGRVSIDLAPGSYTLQLTYRRKTQSIPIRIDGARVVKVIELD